jgi:hypothetical protein
MLVHRERIRLPVFLPIERLMKQPLFAIALVSTALPLFAQSSAFAVHNNAELAQVEASLKSEAEKSPTGEAELHNEWADEILVRSGTLTVVYGGTMSPQHPFGKRPGEFHSSTMEGGTTQVLHAGELMHIPAGVPHWVKVAPGESSCYLVVKER